MGRQKLIIDMKIKNAISKEESEIKLNSLV
jgi:hypothetical protein